MITIENQTVTNSWVDFGSEYSYDRSAIVRLYLKVTINDSSGVKLRVRGKIGSDYYSLITKSIQVDGGIKVYADYIELGNDADQNIVIPIEIDNLIPTLQVQIMADTVGASGATISCKIK